MNIYKMTKEKRAEFKEKMQGYIDLINQLDAAEGNDSGRRCTKCRNVKPLDDFYCNPKYHDGYSTRCRKCLSKAQKSWNKKNAEYLKIYRATKK